MPGIGQPYTKTQRFPQGTGTPYVQPGELLGNGFQIQRNWSGPRTNGMMANTTGRTLPVKRYPGVPFYAKNTSSFTLSGTTKDSTGTPIGSVRVLVFNAHTNEFVAEGLSDGAGAYSITVPTNSPNYFLVTYKAGAPDLTGASRNTLIAVMA